MTDQANETYEVIRNKILAGEYRPAQRLTEAQIVKDLGVSRSHVRNAFQRLSYDGLIDLQPNQGAAVSDVTLADILDIFVGREALELEAYRRSFSRIDEQGMASLDALIEKMRQAISENNYDLYSESAAEFRNTILDLAESPRLKELANTLLLMSSRVVLRKIMIPLRGKNSLEEHEAILQALKGDSLAAVETAFRQHIANLKADIEQYWEIVKP